MTSIESPAVARAIYLMNSMKSIFKLIKIPKYCGLFLLVFLLIVHFSKIGLTDYLKVHHLYLIVITLFIFFLKFYLTELQDEILNNIIELEDIVEHTTPDETDAIVKEIHQFFVSPSIKEFNPDPVIDALILSTTFTKRQYLSFPHPFFDILCSQTCAFLAYQSSIEQAHYICEQLDRNLEKLPSVDHKKFNITNKKNKTLRYIIISFALIYMMRHKEIDLLNKLNKLDLFNPLFIDGHDDIEYLFLKSRQQAIFHEVKKSIKDQFAEIINNMPS